MSTLTSREGNVGSAVDRDSMRHPKWKHDRTTMLLIAVIAASLASGATERQHVAAAGLLLLIAMPFGARLLQRLVLEPPSHAAAIADSPLGYVIGTIGDALFFVPPVVFAFAVWKRRGALQPTLPDHANH